MAVPGLYVEQMPYPCYLLDRFTGAMLFVLPLAMIFAWLFPVAMTIRGIVREKEVAALFEFWHTSLADSVFFNNANLAACVGSLRLSWFITSGAILLFSVAGVTLLLKAGGILVYSDWLLVALYLFLYAISMVAYR